MKCDDGFPDTTGSFGGNKTRSQPVFELSTQVLNPWRYKVSWSQVVAGRPGAIGPGNFPQTPFKWTFHRGGRYGDPNRLATAIKWVTFGAEFGAKVGSRCGVALRNPSKLLARPAGLEPATSGLEMPSRSAMNRHYLC